MAPLSALRRRPPGRRLPAPLLAAVVATLVACGPRPDAPEIAELVEPPLTRQEVLSVDYPTDLVAEGRIRLEEGIFRAPVPGGRGEEVAAQLVDTLAFGSLGDGRAAAAAVLVLSGGGSGTFSWLYLLGREGGAARVLADAYLGDRVEVTGLRLAGDTVFVDLVTQGPEDPMCCPTLLVQRRFVFEGGAGLSEKGEARSEK